MSCNSVVTGKVLSSPGDTAQDSENAATVGLLFGPLSKYDTPNEARSPVFKVGVSCHGLVVRAFDLGPSDVLHVEQVIGNHEGTEFVEPKSKGTWPVIDAENNVVLFILPGRYRLLYKGGNLGSFLVSKQRVPQGTLQAAVAAFDIAVG